MITAIKNIKFNQVFNAKPNNNAAISLPNYNNFSPIYNGSISFGALYIPKKADDFSETVYQNYFQLPKIPLKNGGYYQVEPDESQIECAKELYKGNSVIFEAPTGSGKTAVAHYAITNNLKNGKKTIYTVPIRALANDKLVEFSKIYGIENVGLLTGERKFNTKAPIQIMTTEIYNNQTNSFSENTKGIGTIIYDETHYISDFERGNVWENSIIKTPMNTQILALSATIGNSEKLQSWLQALNPTREVSLVKVDPKERFVPLVWHIHKELEKKNQYSPDAKGTFLPIKKGSILIDDINPDKLTLKQKRAMETLFKSKNNILDFYEMVPDEYQKMANELISIFKEADDDTNYDIEEFKAVLKIIYPKLNKTQIEEIAELLLNEDSIEIERIHTPHHDDNYPALVNNLKDEDMLPAIIFKLSQRGCEDVVEALKFNKLDLTTDKEKKQIEEIINKYKKDFKYLGVNFDKNVLLNGYAYHHSGELPQYRKLIEELFSKKLVKVVAATSTLSAGINMPARTVVITGTTYKSYDAQNQALNFQTISASEFHQMAGRAGRRGIDSVGHVVLYNLKTPPKGFESKPTLNEDGTLKRSVDELKDAYTLLESSADDLVSQFKPDYCLMANYFDDDNSNKEIENLIYNSFKYSLSNDKEKTFNSLSNKFEKYQKVMLDLGFLEENGDRIKITPKGKLLQKGQGTNPLLLIDLIYEQDLKDIEPETLFQIATYISGSSVQQENIELRQAVDDRLKFLLSDDKDKKSVFEKYLQTRNMFRQKEAQLIRTLKQDKIPLSDIVIADDFSGFTGYIWAHSNDLSSDWISNFRKITGTTIKALTETEAKELGEVASIYNRKANEGNTYKTIAQGISLLKQIVRICDYAISYPNLYPDTSYYENLKETAELSMILAKQDLTGGDEL